MKKKDIRSRALKWWSKLTPKQQYDYAYDTFGDGKFWGNQKLTDEDIEILYIDSGGNKG